jgi:hypothetical protein
MPFVAALVEQLGGRNAGITSDTISLSAFPALYALISPAWERGSPRVEDLALPKSLRSGNFTPAMAVIRWMSANLHQDRSHIGFD